jgi:eukaryotic-like serine/threonine-protein kinase
MRTTATGLVLQDTYTLGERIGQGGMGEVYEATHARLPGRYAVKVLRSNLLTNEDASRRFCREAEIMSALRHPHIVQIFDFNTSRVGLPYFVMEYLEGVDLRTRLADSGALPLPALVRIVDAVASALGAAHALGIVSGNLKPANIFLIRAEGQDDFVKVLDVGMPQAAGSDPRTDQFALAAITYAMLTGREPFVGDDHQQPPPISAFVPWHATEVQSVLDRALAKRQQDRFESVVKFAWALRVAAHSVIRGHARAAVPRSPLPLGIDRVPREPARTVALGLAVLGLAAVVVSLVRGEPPTPPPSVSSYAPEVVRIDPPFPSEATAVADPASIR